MEHAVNYDLLMSVMRFLTRHVPRVSVGNTSEQFESCRQHGAVLLTNRI